MLALFSITLSVGGNYLLLGPKDGEKVRSVEQQHSPFLTLNLPRFDLHNRLKSR
jgi:hypothetical protein